MKAIARASGLILALTVLVPGALAGCGQLGSVRCRRSAVTIRVPCGAVQPVGVGHGLAHCPGTIGDGGVLDGELPVALAQ